MGEMTGGVMGLRSDSLPAAVAAVGETVVSTGVSSACLRLALLFLPLSAAEEDDASASALLAEAAAAEDRRVVIARGRIADCGGCRGLTSESVSASWKRESGAAVRCGC